MAVVKWVSFILFFFLNLIIYLFIITGLAQRESCGSKT